MTQNRPAFDKTAASMIEDVRHRQRGRARPKPVAEMSLREIEAAVDAYERWLHKGQITVLLDYSGWMDGNRCHRRRLCLAVEEHRVGH